MSESRNLRSIILILVCLVLLFFFFRNMYLYMQFSRRRSTCQLTIFAWSFHITFTTTFQAPLKQGTTNYRYNRTQNGDIHIKLHLIYEHVKCECTVYSILRNLCETRNLTFLCPQEVPLYAVANMNMSLLSPVLHAMDVQISAKDFRTSPCILQRKK